MLTVSSLVFLASFAVPPIEHPGFEASEAVASWKTWIYKDGADPKIRLDSSDPREGKASLLIEAEDPADVALGQVVRLPPGTVWRARAWVKTEDLEARDKTEVGGTLHVQSTEAATLGTAPGRFGTNPWTEVEAAFRVPPSGEVKLVLFFIGYGKGTGKAWFDALSLEPLRIEGPETVTIRPKRLGRLPVDPKQCGQFIEPLCDLLPSMISQQVVSTSFEEETPWRYAFRREVDRLPRPWYPDGAVHLLDWAIDDAEASNGKRSLRMELKVPGVRAGASQGGFVVKEGVAYRLRLHLKGRGDVGVRASLHGGGAVLAGPESLGKAGADWRIAEARLLARGSSTNASLSVEFTGPGVLWLDRVYLIGEDAVLGLWRPDVVDALRDLRPGAIRFGGSAMFAFEWQKTIGSWDVRAPFAAEYWGGIEENFVGLEEFVALTEYVGAEALLCVRWADQEPEDAAAEVEYFNGSPDSRWGSVRARNGRREPYRVKYWQVGNEVAGAEYEASLPTFVSAMRGADPTIRILSSFPSENTLRVAGSHVDYLCPHHYGCADLGAMDANFREIEGWISGHPRPGQDPVRIAVTEWNVTAGGWGRERATMLTLSNALIVSRYHHVMHRHADSVEISNRSNLSDSFCSGILQPGPGWMVLTPAYHAQRLYSRGSDSYPIECERQGRLPWSIEDPDLSALLSADGTMLRLYAVHSTAESSEVRIRLDGFGGKPRSATAWVLADGESPPSVEATNSRDDPRRVDVSRRPVDLGESPIRLRLEPYSLTLLECEFPQAGS